ncbi:hypothetical protein, partial [Escherichia coli]|uniref:hypothetical protein n=1 Tax=Escherichia coli TaxID=562 RepID=UPI001AA16138
LMMNPVPWLQMTNMISYQGLVRTFPRRIALTGVLGMNLNSGVFSIPFLSLFVILMSLQILSTKSII